MSQAAYLAKHGTPMLVDYVNQELAADRRVVVSTEHWVCLVPYWAAWPYEIMILPRRHVKRLPDLTGGM